MKRLFLVAMMCIALVSLLVGPSAMAAGKSIQGNVNLVEKNSDWTIIPGGAWGKYNYALDKSDPAEAMISGVFNGHGLVAGTEYTLVEYNGYPDVTVLGTGVVNASGDIHIAVPSTSIGTPQTWDGDYLDQPAGYKIWLVHSTDLDGTNIIGWDPSNWLFETSLVR